MGLRDRLKGLSTSTYTIDDERLQCRFEGVECVRIADVAPRRRVIIAGEVVALQVVPRAGSSWLEVIVSDGTGKAVGIFTGRRRIHGLEPGHPVVFEGVPGKIDGRLQIMNPIYTLL